MERINPFLIILRNRLYIIFKITFNNSNTRSVNYLNARAAFDYTGCTAFFQHCIIYKRAIFHGYTQSCGAAVNIHEIIFAAKAL